VAPRVPLHHAFHVVPPHVAGAITMKYLRGSWFVVFLALSAALIATVAVAKDVQPSATVTPAPQPYGWMLRHGDMNNRVRQGNVDLIFIGDSITEGWEGSGKDVWKKYYGKRNAVNLGIGGDRTQNVLWRLDHGNIDGISPKLAVLMIGTNNAGGNTPEEIAAGVKAIVEKLRAKLPQTKVLVLGIFPRSASSQDSLRQVNTKTNEIIAKLADGQDVFYLDIGPKFLTDDGTLTKDVMPDLLHLNAKSYETWAEAIEPTVAKLMGEQRKSARTTEPVESQEEWWQERQKEVNARIAQGNVDLLFIGDSITHFWEGAPYWEGEEGKEVWQKYYGNRNAANLGFSGDHTEHVLWRLDHGNIDGIAPKLAVVMIGTNNAAHPPVDCPEDIAAGVKAIVDKLRAKLPTTKILLMAIFPRGADNSDAYRQTGQAANKIISKLADDKNVYYLDIGQKFLNPDGTLSTNIMPDLLHPNARGYEIWAESIEPTVAKLMGEK
jgi:lysophospholipase L1-like esterase